MNKQKLIYIIAVTLVTSLSVVGGRASDQHEEKCLYYVEYFKYGNASSNQITHETLPFLDREFLQQTGGGDEETKIKRAIGSVELVLLVRSAQNGIKIKEMGEDAKKQYAQQQMVLELHNISKGDLKDQYLQHDIIPIEDLALILENVKKDIIAHKPESKCNLQ